MLRSWIKKLVGASPTGNTATLAPEHRFYVVGDIHGRLDLLQQILTQLDPDVPVVFTGDYIDRGDHSAQVLRHLRHLSGGATRLVVCLLGNHEEMLLRFLHDPERTHRLWMRNGGYQTLLSFGLGGLTPDMTTDQAVGAADQLRRAMGAPLLDWLEGLPLSWSNGNVAIVHAALDPRKDCDRQSRDVCLWGHPEFLTRPRSDGMWVVHGHTIVPQPRIRNRVVSIDTGAFATGRLTAAEIGPGKVRFLNTGPVQA
ncbi:serine/threonine protein phosphatase 1 [Ruegeria intermedia]|uniref:Serine/threonine protein phosphatase 1 n=1 Tax=Ruegeria intermedia TaxID=996115 RepID=A0A1M4ZKK8_9RHOB|nr:metallophosphoesterase family protein [Ruegeria intermedia]SHF18508.1 serine/threonine protein phosphatase 1 [Ruegeria intermedia]